MLILIRRNIVIRIMEISLEELETTIEQWPINSYQQDCDNRDILIIQSIHVKFLVSIAMPQNLSRYIEIILEVPHGSILGPNLSLVYILIN